MGCAANNPQTTQTTVKQFRAILIGPPGVGKGTQCDLLKNKVEYSHVSTGDLVRAEIKNNTEIGQQIKQITENGGLVPDLTIEQLLKNHFKSLPPNHSWLLDGFPRTEEQAKFLTGEHFDVTHVIEMQGDEAEITERLGGRLFDPETGSTYHKTNNPPPADIAARCIIRKDDSPEVIAQRFQVFRESAEAIRKQFGSLVKKVETKGKSIKEIEEQIQKILM
ncbi:Adenylate_kinase 1 [Hexamita inflata]|uniref:Adenylate kinase 1 n=1 Tax=Hexamita inflata TaxID=28002 RepID=A0AA86TLS3_9EUKA|nr:Adenylate kinase 1 [Hexamita inflata]